MHTSHTPPSLQVVGREYDSLELDGSGDLEVYETVYALLNHLSPSYPSSFQHALADKLENLDQRQNPWSTADSGSSEVRMSTVVAWGLCVSINLLHTLFVFVHSSSSCPHSLQTETASKFITDSINTCLCTLTLGHIPGPYWKKSVLNVARE